MPDSKTENGCDFVLNSLDSAIMQGAGKVCGTMSPREFSELWYRTDEIAGGIARSRKLLTNGGIPENVYSMEFAEWLTEQYRLAMAKGIQIGQRVVN